MQPEGLLNYPPRPPRVRKNCARWKLTLFRITRGYFRWCSELHAAARESLGNFARLPPKVFRTTRGYSRGCSESRTDTSEGFQNYAPRPAKVLKITRGGDRRSSEPRAGIRNHRVPHSRSPRNGACAALAMHMSCACTARCARGVLEVLL